MRNGRVLTTGAAALAMAVMAAPASAGMLSGYLKLPDIDGESQRSASAGIEPDEIDNSVTQTATAQVGRGQTKARAKVDTFAADTQQAARKDSGDAHLDYLVITMEHAHAEGDTDAVGPVRWMAPESTRDAASGLPTGKRQHKPLSVVKEIDKASPDMARSSTSGAAGAGKVKFDRLTMKKKSDTMTVLPPRDMAGPGQVTLATALPDCAVGTRYPHALIGEEGGEEVKLVQVSVAQCASEEVTLNYEHIKWEY